MKQQPIKWPALLLDHFPHKKNQSNNLFLITGDIGVGKTTWRQRWIDSAPTALARISTHLDCSKGHRFS